MKLTVDATVTLDFDPEDLDDEALRACIAVAKSRGMIPATDVTVDALAAAVHRAYSSLLRGNIPVAVAQLAAVMPAEEGAAAIKGAIGAAMASRGQSGPRPHFADGPQPPANGHYSDRQPYPRRIPRD